MWTVNFQMFKLVLEKAEEPEIKLTTSTGSSRKQESSRKIKSTFALLTIPKPFLYGSQQTGKFFKKWKSQTTLPASWEICMQVKKQQLEPDMEQLTGSKSGKEYVKAVYCHCIFKLNLNKLSLFNLYVEYIMQNVRLDKVQAAFKTARETSITSDTQMTPPFWQKAKRN